MEDQSLPTISSFIIRFVHEPSLSGEGSSSYRASIRHIQSDQVHNFTSWEDATAFIGKFIPNLVDLDRPVKKPE